MTTDGHTHADTCAHGTVERERELGWGEGERVGRREVRREGGRSSWEGKAKPQNRKQGIRCFLVFAHHHGSITSFVYVTNFGYMPVHSVVCTEDTEVSTQARLPPSRTQRIAGDPEIPQADVSVHNNLY